MIIGPVNDFMSDPKAKVPAHEYSTAAKVLKIYKIAGNIGSILLVTIAVGIFGVLLWMSLVSDPVMFFTALIGVLAFLGATAAINYYNHNKEIISLAKQRGVIDE